MEKLTVRAFTFGSFVKLCTVIAFPLGVCLGLIAFVFSLIDVDVTVNIGSITLTGISAGIVAIPLSPVVLVVVGIIYAIISYLPFKWFLRMIKGVALDGQYGYTDKTGKRV